MEEISRILLIFIPSAGSISKINFISNYSISIYIISVNRYLKLKDIKH